MSLNSGGLGRQRNFSFGGRAGKKRDLGENLFGFV